MAWIYYYFGSDQDGIGLSTFFGVQLHLVTSPGANGRRSAVQVKIMSFPADDFSVVLCVATRFSNVRYFCRAASRELHGRGRRAVGAAPNPTARAPRRNGHFWSGRKERKSPLLTDDFSIVLWLQYRFILVLFGPAFILLNLYSM